MTVNPLSAVTWRSAWYPLAFALASYLLVATARMHAGVARGLLQAPGDPLATAKDVLTRPGPLLVFFSHNDI